MEVIGSSWRKRAFMNHSITVSLKYLMQFSSEIKKVRGLLAIKTGKTSGACSQLLEVFPVWLTFFQISLVIRYNLLKTKNTRGVKVVFCKNCGNKLNGRGGFCSNCGASSSGSNPNSNQNYSQNSGVGPSQGGYQAPRSGGGGSSSWQIVAIALAALVVFVGAAGGAYLLFSDSKTSKEPRVGQNGNVDNQGENNQAGQDDSGARDSSKRDDLERQNQELKAEERALMEENERLRARIDYLSDSIYGRHSNSQAHIGGSYFGDTYYLTWSELDTYSRADIELIRNEIYARNGYIFSEARYRDYFSSMSWYVPNAGFHEGMFNSVERENVDLIVEYEAYMGWR